jgi:hypothetical protein
MVDQIVSEVSRSNGLRLYADASDDEVVAFELAARAKQKNRQLCWLVTLLSLGVILFFVMTALFPTAGRNSNAEAQRRDATTLPDAGVKREEESTTSEMIPFKESDRFGLIPILPGLIPTLPPVLMCTSEAIVGATAPMSSLIHGLLQRGAELSRLPPTVHVR